MKSCKKKQADAPASPPPSPDPGARALYVHVPFCRAKCRYCDFYSRPGEPEMMDAYVDAVLTEWRLCEGQVVKPLNSLYFGGGTPTALGPERLNKLLRELTPVTGEEAEISVESNPGTVDADIAAVLLEHGVNRVTLGAQSFDNGQLAFLGRMHRAEEIVQAAETLRAAGLANLAVDLIYAIPSQSLDSWQQSLAAAVALHPQHISCYALSFEDHTKLGDDLQAGRVEEVDDETQRSMFDLAVEYLQSAGYEQYEISNFAQPKRPCRHNLVYWRNEHYLGLGPGACSYVQGVRRTNKPDTAAYLHCLNGPVPTLPPTDAEQLTGRDAMAETLMLALRLIEGVDISAFTRRFGVSPVDAFPKTFRRYIQQQAVEHTSTHVRIARKALFTSNCILAEILEEG